MPDNDPYEEDLSIGGDLRLGKREPLPERASLQVGDFLGAAVEIPDHPPVSPAPDINWTMDRNDEAGVCVVAGLNHTLQAIAWNLNQPRIPWSDSEILELYRTQNPNFTWERAGTQDDQGMVIQHFLEECVRRGHILAFARIDHENHELMRAATYIGGGIMTGEMLRTAHANLDLWDYSKSAPWGGHCTTTVGYSAEQFDCVTWGQRTPYTLRFGETHLDEAWFVLTPALVNSPGFRNSFDLRGFADAVADLTDGKVIVPVPPVVPDLPPAPPAVDPGPPVPTDPAWDDFPYELLKAWASTLPKTDTKRERRAKLAFRQWAADHDVDRRNASTRRVVYDAEGNKIGEVDLAGSFWASQG